MVVNSDSNFVPGTSSRATGIMAIFNADRVFARSLAEDDQEEAEDVGEDVVDFSDDEDHGRRQLADENANLQRFA